METENEKTLEQAQLLEEMSKDYWELVNQESCQMFVNAQRLSGLTIRAIALQAGAEALKEQVNKGEQKNKGADNGILSNTIRSEVL